MNNKQTSAQFSIESELPLKETKRAGTNTKEPQSNKEQQNPPRMMSLFNFAWAMKFVRGNFIQSEQESQLERPGINLQRRGQNTKQPKGTGR